MLDNLASKMGTMILLNTITQFMNYCIDEKIEPTVTNIREYVFKKTGQNLDNEMIELLLKMLLGNVQLAIIFAVNEASEVVAENMLDKPSNWWGFVRGIL